MKTIRILLAGLVLFLSACEGPAFFSSSLSEPGEAPIDQSIVGIWFVRPSDDEAYVLNIAQMGEDRLGIILSIMDIDAKSEDSLRSSDVSFHLTAHPSDVNGRRYYNVMIIGATNFEEFEDPEKLEKLAGFMIHDLTVIDDEWLVISVIMENSPGRLAGWSESNSRRVRKTAKYNVSRDDLRRLLSTADPEELFQPFLFFRRMQVLEVESLPPEIRNERHWKF